MENRKPLITIIIPCRNEEAFIAGCLKSLLVNDYPNYLMEIFVVDGASSDKTRKIAELFASKYPFIRILNNPKKYTASAFNIGIKESRGDLIILCGAHSTYETDYISKCVQCSYQYNADDVGGALKIMPANNRLFAKAIAICISSAFGAGNSVFRTGSKTEREVDTVFGGCYKREVFGRVGLFNEDLVRSQDMEFNLRLKAAGGKIFLCPDIVAYYYPKGSLKDFFWHNIQDGIWAILPLKFSKTTLKLRHYIPLIFILTLPVSIWPYILANIFFSLKIAISKKNILYLFAMPVVFFLRHFGYGIGSIWGLIKLII